MSNIFVKNIYVQISSSLGTGSQYTGSRFSFTIPNVSRAKNTKKELEWKADNIRFEVILIFTLCKMRTPRARALSQTFL